MTSRTQRCRAVAPLLLAAGAVALAAPLLLAGPAAASCAGPLTPAALLDRGADVVLGVAEEVRGHRALLDVEEVWSGEDRAPEIRVVTGETVRNVQSSTDVELVEGDRYLVALDGSRTSVCSVLVVGDGRPVAGQVSVAEVEAARPATARAPVVGADAGDVPGPPWAAVAAGVLGWAAITALVLLAGSRLRRSSRRSRADGGRRPLR
ncbi:hypothetical protein [uncultured Pseudokineococcus sp.]|uniref:hypothetical protein n=1 Tax=uncultured Pseudokineococcus sp. TaxID=1642928 RepID=UPI00261AFBE3|nr:hypothetical protein [uncultured Pseudokineococcus sp.]